MKRVNKVNPHMPSLVNQNPGQQVNIKGAKPLGITLEPGTAETFGAPLIAGALTFLANAGGRFYQNDGKKISDKEANGIAAFATGLGMLPTITKTFDPPAQFSGQPLLNIGGFGILAIGALVGNFTAKQEKYKNRLPEIAASTLLAVPLAIPTLFGGQDGFKKAILPYGAALTGLWLSSKYVPAKRGK